MKYPDKKYFDLTLDQRISLKGEFETNPDCIGYKAIMCLWSFIDAIEYFLNDDYLSFLRREIFEDWETV